MKLFKKNNDDLEDDTVSLISDANRNKQHKAGKKNKQPLYKRIPRITLWILFYAHCALLSITIFPLYATPYFSISGPQKLWEGTADLAAACAGPMPPKTLLMLRSTTLRGDLQDKNITVQAALFVHPDDRTNSTLDGASDVLPDHRKRLLSSDHYNGGASFGVSGREQRVACPEMFAPVDANQDNAWHYYQDIGFDCMTEMYEDIKFMPFNKEHIENSTDYNGFCERSQHSTLFHFNLTGVRTVSPLYFHIRLLDHGSKHNGPSPPCRHAADCQGFFEDLKYNHTTAKFRQVIEEPVCHGGRCAAALHLPKEKDGCNKDADGTQDRGSARQCENKHCVFQVFWMATPELPQVLSAWTLWTWPTLLSIMGLVVWVVCGLWLARRWHLAYLQNYYVRSEVFPVQEGSVYDIKLVITGSHFSRYSGCFTLTAEDDNDDGDDDNNYNKFVNDNNRNNKGIENRSDEINKNKDDSQQSTSSRTKMAQMWADLRRGWDDTTVAGEEGQHLLHRYPFNVTLDEEDYEGGTQVSVVLRTTYRAVHSHPRVSFDVQWGEEFTTAHFRAPIVQVVIRKHVPVTVKTRLNILLMPIFFLSHLLIRIPRRNSFVKYSDYIFLVLFIASVHSVWLFFFASNMLTNFIPEEFWGNASERPVLPLLCYVILVCSVLVTAILSRLPFCRRPPRMPRAIRRRAKKLGLPKERNAFLIEPSVHDSGHATEQSQQQLSVIPIPDSGPLSSQYDVGGDDDDDNYGSDRKEMSFELGHSPSLGGNASSSNLRSAHGQSSSSLTSTSSFPARRFAATSAGYRQNTGKTAKRKSKESTSNKTQEGKENSQIDQAKDSQRRGTLVELSDSDGDSGSMMPLTSSASWRDVSQLEHVTSGSNVSRDSTVQRSQTQPDISVQIERGNGENSYADGVEVEATSTPLLTPQNSYNDSDNNDNNFG